jgi:hypothetical protein
MGLGGPGELRIRGSEERKVNLSLEMDKVI